ncbi:recombination regulator RecX [Peribacillus deserti]|uniref:Regulatory protein RecX n=1 Tax=Peribacillus deserti TaxID=673318 RepID=A0A2N5MBY2_9BACI|nr:recombination regulator RecX [Peribacillus deserti]PLT31872.1 recombination regulator RecX [Peribacillus deserti]
MARISKITAQKKRADRFNIFIDKGKGEEYAFSVDEDVLIKFDLKKGKEINEFDFIEIGFQEDIQKGLNQALHYLSHRMRTETEIRTLLKKKEYGDHVIQEVIHKLYGYNYLDDSQFAIAYVRTQMNSSVKGKGIIYKELKEKGISEQNIQTGLKEYSYEMELENALKLAEKTVKQAKSSSARESRQKTELALMRKGFSSDIIQEAIRGISFEKDVDDEWDAILVQGMKAHRRYQKFTGFEYRQKMKQALYRKGFASELIDRFLDEGIEDFQNH